MVIRNIVGDQNPYANKNVERQETSGAQKAQQTSSSSSSSSSASSSTDRVELSSQARLMGTAMQTASESSDVRREKVDELKRQVQNGTYEPDIQKAAANLVRDDLDMLV